MPRVRPRDRFGVPPKNETNRLRSSPGTSRRRRPHPGGGNGSVASGPEAWPGSHTQALASPPLWRAADSAFAGAVIAAANDSKARVLSPPPVQRKTLRWPARVVPRCRQPARENVSPAGRSAGPFSRCWWQPIRWVASPATERGNYAGPSPLLGSGDGRTAAQTTPRSPRPAPPRSSPTLPLRHRTATRPAPRGPSRLLPLLHRLRRSRPGRPETAAWTRAAIRRRLFDIPTPQRARRCGATHSPGQSARVVSLAV